MKKFKNKKTYLSTLFLLSSVVATAGTWTGAVSSDWGNPLNWLEGTIPTQSGMTIIEDYDSVSTTVVYDNSGPLPEQIYVSDSGGNSQPDNFDVTINNAVLGASANFDFTSVSDENGTIKSTISNMTSTERQDASYFISNSTAGISTMNIDGLSLSSTIYNVFETFNMNYNVGYPSISNINLSNSKISADTGGNQFHTDDGDGSESHIIVTNSDLKGSYDIDMQNHASYSELIFINTTIDQNYTPTSAVGSGWQNNGQIRVYAHHAGEVVITLDNTDLTMNGSNNWNITALDAGSIVEMNISNGSNVNLANLANSNQIVFQVLSGGTANFNIKDSTVDFAVDSAGLGVIDPLFKLSGFTTYPDSVPTTANMLVDNSTFTTNQLNIASFEAPEDTMNLTLSNGGNYIAPSLGVDNINGLDLTNNLIVNIGSATGVAPVAPGLMTLASPIDLPYGATFNFNHTSTDGSYTFTPSIQQTTYNYDINVNALAGYTNLGGANSNYYGTTTVSSGATLNTEVASGFSPNSDFIVNSGGTLSFGTVDQRVATLQNDGLVYWNNLGRTLTVTGDYTSNAGTINLETYLADDSSTTDKLVVEGNTSGTSTLIVRPAAGSPGAQTTEGIKVIDIAGTSGATFTLASPVQAGAYEYNLFKNGVSTPTDGDWYLRSTLIPTPTTPVTPIYRPGTSNYVSGQTANAEQGFAALGTLHERMNEQQVVLSIDKQTWARYYGNRQSNDGATRFNYDQDINGFQIGQDLYNRTTDNGTVVHSGVMFDYSYSSVDFTDRVREDALLDNTTGTMNGTSYGLGGYYTAINGDESYLDVVGMVSKLDNKFEDSYGMKSTQDGYRLGLSVEAGKKLTELGKWKVEGQGQLAYQYASYDNFNDDISGIDGYSASTLRGRLGVRVYRPLESTKEMKQNDIAQVYGVANVIQDFINPTDVTVGGANVSEKFDTTMLEVGGGFQVPISGASYIYTDARYDRSIKGNKSQGKLTIGFKTQF